MTASESDPTRRGFEALLDAHRARLVRMARRIVRNDADAEDVVQQTAMAVWLAAQKSPIRQQERYLYRAVRLNALRHRARRRRLTPLDDHPADTERDASNPWDDIDPFTLEQAIADLPPAQQTVIRMRYWLGMTFRQIGEELNLSMNTAASRCRYARETLRQVLKRDIDDEDR